MDEARPDDGGVVSLTHPARVCTYAATASAAPPYYYTAGAVLHGFSPLPSVYCVFFNALLLLLLMRFLLFFFNTRRCPTDPHFASSSSPSSSLTPPRSGRYGGTSARVLTSTKQEKRKRNARGWGIKRKTVSAAAGRLFRVHARLALYASHNHRADAPPDCSTQICFLVYG